jgi:hypothetical protein
MRSSGKKKPPIGGGEARLAASLARRRARATFAQEGESSAGQLLAELRRAIDELEQIRTRILGMVTDTLSEGLSLSDVKALCLLVNLKYEEFPHQTLTELLVGLLAHADRHHLTVLLLDTVREHYPHIHIP